MECCGPATDSDWDDKRINPHGWTEAQVLNHKAECLLLAYQALSYAERLQRGMRLNADENKLLKQFDFSAIGKAGAAKRHAPMAKLRTWAITHYRAGKWPSANQAAHDLKCRVIEYGRTIDANLTEQNAQRTIAEWFRKSA